MAHYRLRDGSTVTADELDNVSDQDLEELVQDMKDSEAFAIQSGGRDSMIEYLREQL